MKKTLVVLMVVVCVLVVTQNESGAVHNTLSSGMIVSVDSFEISNAAMNQDSSPSSVIASSTDQNKPSHKLPEPATLMLFGVGLLSLTTFKKMFKR